MINHVSDFHEQPSVHVKCEVSSALISVDLFYCNSLNASGSFSSLPPEVHVSTLNTQHSDVRLCTGFSGAGQVFCVKGDVSFTFQLIFSSIYEIRDGLFFHEVTERLATTSIFLLVLCFHPGFPPDGPEHQPLRAPAASLDRLTLDHGSPLF